MSALGEMRATANRLRASEVGMVLSTDPAARPGLVQDVVAVEKLLMDKEQALASLVSGPQQAQLYADFKLHRENYFRVQRELTALSQAGETGQAQAAKMLHQDSQVAFIAMAEMVKAIRNVTDLVAQCGAAL